MPEKKKKVCAYVRVSTDRQEELSPDSQIRLIQEYATAHNMLLTHIYQEEHGISGKSASKRPAFQEMIAACKEKEHPYDAILLWKFSRFSRNIDESTYYKSILRKKCNVDVISISEPVIEGMYGRLIEMVIEWSDEFYSFNLSGEVMRGMSQNALQGGYNSLPPMGYTKAPYPDAIPKIHPEEALIVKRIFHMYANQGFTKSDIATILNQEGVLTSRGNLWESRSINYILENPFYIGKYRWNYFDPKNHRRKAQEEVILADARHEPVISQKLWEAAAKRLQADHQKNSFGKKRNVASQKHWLSGMIKCSGCGASLGYGKPGRSKPYFRCWKSSKGQCCKGKNVKEADLVLAVLSIIHGLLTSDTTYVYTLKESARDNSQHEFLQKQLLALSAKEKRIKEAYQNGIDTIEEYRDNKKKTKEARDALERQLQMLAVSSREDTCKILDSEKLFQLFQEDTLCYIHKGNALRQVFECFIYDADTNTLTPVLSL